MAKIQYVLTPHWHAHLFQSPDILIIDVPSVMESIPTLALPENIAIVPNDPHSPAFVIFTSGSSGAPKGVILEHRAICSSAHHHGRAMGVDPESKVLQCAPYTFDMSIYDIFTTLIQSGYVCIISASDRINDILGTIQDTNANWVFFTPSMLCALEVNDVRSLKTILLAD